MVVLFLGIVAALAALTAAGGLLVLRRRRAAGRGRSTAGVPPRTGSRTAFRVTRLPGRRTRIDDQLYGGPFLYWVPDGRGGSRLAGDFIPEPDLGGVTRPQRTGPRRGPRRAG